MDLSPLQRLDQTARQWVPFSATTLLMLFGLTPLYVPAFSSVTPMLTLIAIYYWAVYRPEVLGYGAGFAVGLLEDLLVGTPLGSTSLILMLCQWLVFYQQKFFNGRPFHVVWAAFVLVSVSAVILRWILVGIFSTSGFVSFGPGIATVAFTVALYPLVGWLLAQAHTRLMSPP